MVFTDADADATRDGGEGGRGAIVVHLYAADGTTLLGTATTDPAGAYSFSIANVPGFATRRLRRARDAAARRVLLGPVLPRRSR